MVDNTVFADALVPHEEEGRLWEAFGSGLVGVGGEGGGGGQWGFEFRIGGCRVLPFGGVGDNVTVSHTLLGDTTFPLRHETCQQGTVHQRPQILPTTTPFQPLVHVLQLS